ncbi:hypothetical protein [Spirosoma rigui]|uniref:hypothetical protein n=1 Tax=Spirosoma rigui TaxID=564064 RepID=UPI0009B06B2D|nr:hypothetical protein [Spirosoma rigui]
MRQALLVTFLVVGSISFLIGSWLALIDWMDAIATGFYRSNYLEMVLEVLALAAYGYLSLRFIKSRLTHM